MSRAFAREGSRRRRHEANAFSRCVSTPIIVALGGSLLGPEVDENHSWLSDLCDACVELTRRGEKLGLVVGGGFRAREAIAEARATISDVAELDEIGIAATRVNASIIIRALKARGLDVCAEIPETWHEGASALSTHPIVVMGGTEPGHTTDNVAIRLAICCKATRCIIATNVAHVYDSDPRINPNARTIENMTLSELQGIVGPPQHGKAGGSGVIDPIGVAAAVEENLPLAVLDGRDPSILRSAILGGTFTGTTIRTDE